MAEALTCPTCSYPLTPPDPYAISMQCPACRNFIVIPHAQNTGAQLGSEDERLKEVAALTRAGLKIQAIKLYRQITNVGLAEAKDAVERLAANQPPRPRAASGSGVEMYAWDQPSAQPTSPPALGTGMEEVAAALNAGNKLEAIKVYRRITGVDLKTAKDAVEAIERGLPAQSIRPRNTAGAGAPSSTLLIALVIIGLALAIIACALMVLLRTA